MTAKTSDFSNLIYYNPAGPGFNPVASATMTGPTSIDEGATATFNVTTWGIPDGPVYWWVSGLTNITTDRITPGLASQATILNNRLTFAITVSANNATAAGAQSYTINFGKVQNTALQSITVTVADTSQTATYTLTSDASIDEGGGLTFTASGTNIPDGGYYWTIETGGGDFTTTSGSLGITDNYGSFIVVPNADATAEGSETFTVALRSGSISGPILVTSAAITINDTSQGQPTPYSLSFNGTSDFYEVLGTTTDWRLELDWTIEFWSKAAGASGAGPKTIMSQGPSVGLIDIYYESGNLCINDTRGPICAEPTPGVWTHVALVCNGGGNDLNVFYNGVNVYNGGGYYLSDDTTTLAIGRRGPTNNFQHFPGKLTGIRITNTAIYTGAFNPYTQALPPTKVTGTKLLMNPTDVNTLADLSDSAHTFSGNSGSGDDQPALSGFHTYKAVTPFNGTTPGQAYFLRAEYPGIESVPVGATMTSAIFANPNAPVTINGSQVWVNQLYWVLTYSDPGGTRTTVPGDTFTITW